METPLAFLVTLKNWPRHFVIYAARSRGHAKAGAWRSLHEANFIPPYRYTDIIAKRLPQFDAKAQQYAGLYGPVQMGWRDGRDSWGLGDEKIDGIDTED